MQVNEFNDATDDSNDDGYDENTTTEFILESCREQNRLIGSNKSDMYDITEAIFNETIILDCHYCNEEDLPKSKIWYKIDLLNKTPHEVKLDMHKDEKINRISVSVDHSLIIHNLSMTDAGTYYCQGFQKEKLEDVFDFIIDISENSPNKSEKGNITSWKRYHDDYMNPINRILRTSNDNEFLHLRNDLKTQLEVITDWKPYFKPCEVCGRPPGEAIQEKEGFCRVKIENNNSEIANITELSEKVQYFLNLPKVTCRSLLLQELFPTIGNMTKQLKDFIIVKKCEGVCNPDAEGLNRGWKFSNSKKYKYRRTMTLNEGDHLTLVCPEATLDNEISWRRNGKVLTQGEPLITNNKDLDSIHIVVDAYYSLYLLHVTEKESGNYTCQVDSIRMQQIRIYVVSKSKLLTAAFLRHMKYLMFVLFMSGTCYCGGIIIACKKKHTFKTYEQIASSPI